MILAGHLPKLEAHALKAMNAVVRLPAAERENLQAIIFEIKAALIEQAAFNRRLSDSVGVESDTAVTSESWSRHFLLMGG